MTPDLRELRYFVAVAEELNFTQAARRLHVSQPSLSSAVRQLETRVGITLLQRTTRRVDLTPAGATLLAHAREVLEASSLLDGALRAHRDGKGGRIDLGIFGRGAGELTMPIIEAFRSAHPEVELRVTDVGSTELVTALVDGRIDVLLAGGSLSDERLDVQLLFHEPRPFFDPLPVVLAARQGDRNRHVADFCATAERVTAEAQAADAALVAVAVAA